MISAVQEGLSDVFVASREKKNNPKLPQRVGTINPIWGVVVKECASQKGKKKKPPPESEVLNPE